MRNTYLSVNFGDFVEGKTNQTADPYIQLLSITNGSTSSIHDDFVKARGNARSWDPSDTLLDRIKKHLVIVIVVAAGAGLLLLGGIAACCLRNRRIRRTPGGFMNFQSSYKPLQDPAPPSYDMNPVGGYNAPPPPPRGNYNNPWDSHY